MPSFRLKREFKPRIRGSGFRDARLIVIASEGLHTENKYFRDLASKEYFPNPKVHVEVLPRKETASSPNKVIQQLDQFRREYKLKRQDELWMVIDFDKWGGKALSEIAAICTTKNYRLAVSNPCFELWLLLHLKSLDEYPQTIINEFLDNPKVSRKRCRLDEELLTLLGSYNKSNPDTSQFLPNVELAIQRAKCIDKHPEHRWPNSLGTRVYLLAENIIKR